MKKLIVVVTDTFDPHADDVIAALGRMGHEPVRLNTSAIPMKASLSVTQDNEAHAITIALHDSARHIHFDDIHSVWWRRPGQFPLPATLTEQERTFVTGEIKHVWDGIWASLNCYWMSQPQHIKDASWKIEQLQRAVRFGFEVPRTLITSSPDDVRAFYETCRGRVIYKVMSDPFLGMSKVQQADFSVAHGVRATLITEKELQALDSVQLAPCQFQQYVPKALELRVTIIGEEIFAAEIHSQTDPRTTIDWRNFDVSIPYCKTTLPDDLAARCLDYVKSYGLNFSTMDFILTPDGEYVFIENNPNGQFIFIEKLVPELKMTEAVAACLVRGANN